MCEALPMTSKGNGHGELFEQVEELQRDISEGKGMWWNAGKAVDVTLRILPTSLLSQLGRSGELSRSRSHRQTLRTTLISCMS